jgi:hypothetical protein
MSGFIEGRQPIAPSAGVLVVHLNRGTETITSGGGLAQLQEAGATELQSVVVARISLQNGFVDLQGFCNQALLVQGQSFAEALDDMVARGRHRPLVGTAQIAQAARSWASDCTVANHLVANCWG